MKLLKRIGLIMLVVLVGIQLIPYRTNQDKVVSPSDFIVTNGVPENIGHILRTSCYNCHSNNTSYPWYSRVQPIGWFLQNHIDKGKAELNFSEFGSYSVRKQKSKLSSMVSQVEKNEMPLSTYTFIHRDARLSQENKKALIDYLNALKDYQDSQYSEDKFSHHRIKKTKSFNVLQKKSNGKVSYFESEENFNHFK